MRRVDSLQKIEFIQLKKLKLWLTRKIVPISSEAITIILLSLEYSYKGML